MNAQHEQWSLPFTTSCKHLTIYLVEKGLSLNSCRMSPPAQAWLNTCVPFMCMYLRVGIWAVFSLHQVGEFSAGCHVRRIHPCHEVSSAYLLMILIQSSMLNYNMFCSTIWYTNICGVMSINDSREESDLPDGGECPIPALCPDGAGFLLKTLCVAVNAI